MYAAGWDRQLLRSCQHSLRGTSSVVVSGEHSRAAVFLVETTQRKSPSGASLGGAIDVSSAVV